MENGNARVYVCNAPVEDGYSQNLLYVESNRGCIGIANCPKTGCYHVGGPEDLGFLAEFMTERGVQPVKVDDEVLQSLFDAMNDGERGVAALDIVKRALLSE
ncbi:MAG: hypothetical protein KKF56_04750 [Nanoarchaeota archaeon]|nr:hypothetical protein [Nanoarchaeota archaeon]